MAAAIKKVIGRAISGMMQTVIGQATNGSHH